MLDLKGKVALVTGAGTVGPGWGNGKATAVLLARQGAQVFGTDIELKAAEETRAIIEKEGGNCTVRRCDMTDTAEVGAAVAACVERYGRIDILVNNVGGSAPGDPVSMTEEVWDKQLDQKPEERVPGLQARAADDGEAGGRRDREHRVGGRLQPPGRRARPRRLQHREVRIGRLHAVDC